jgi:hypothetical protein
MIETANIVMKRCPDLKIKHRHVNPMKYSHDDDGRYRYEAMFYQEIKRRNGKLMEH